MAVKGSLFLVVVSLLFLTGLVDYFVNVEKNQCEMTYMFQWPEYIPVELPDDVRAQHPQYNLYVYGEGDYADQLKEKVYRGVPVLFIPGNAGSYRQVRSLGSVSMNMAISRGTKFHFNYFSADLNEEFSGVFGPVLEKQLAFIHHCVKHILTLYSVQNNPPKSVILVGHSMGGVLATSLFTLPNFDPSTVRLILTQATPHVDPLILVDSSLAQFYDRLHSFWSSNHSSFLPDLTLISQGGGARDILVPSRFTPVSRRYPQLSTFFAVTTHVPNAWASTDHLCIVWCKQIVLETVRSMFEVINRKTKQLREGSSLLRPPFAYYLDEYTGHKYKRRKEMAVVDFQKSGKWVSMLSASWKYRVDQNKRSTSFYMPLTEFEQFDAVTIVSNVRVKAWIYLCNVTDDAEAKLFKAIDYSSNARLIPPAYSNRKILLLRRENFHERMNSIVLLVPSTSYAVDICVEWIQTHKRFLNYSVPMLWSHIKWFPNTIYHRNTIFQNTAADVQFYDITLSGFTSNLQAFSLVLSAESCENTSRPNVGVVLQFTVLEHNEDTYKFIPISALSSSPSTFTAKLQLGHARNTPHLRVILSTLCHGYRLDISISWIEVLGQLIRHYAHLLPAFFIFNALLAFSWQLHSLAESCTCPAFLESVRAYAQPYRCLIPAALISYIVRLDYFWPLLDDLSIPFDDAGLRSEGTSGLYLLSLYAIAYALTVLQVKTLSVIIWFLSKVLNAVLCFAASRYWLSMVLRYCVYVLLLFGILLSVTTCGSLGLLIATWISFCCLLIFPQESDRHNLSFTIFVFASYLSILSAPCLITWLKNFQYDPALFSDPSAFHGAVSCTTVLVLLLAELPVLAGATYTFLARLAHGATILAAMYGIKSLYRTSYITSLVLICFAVQQVFVLVLHRQIRSQPSNAHKKIDQ